MKITRNSQKSELEIGTEIVRTSVQVLSNNKDYTTIDKYTVTGHRKAKNGLKIRLQHELGYGINDVDFEWKVDGISTTWVTS